MKNIEWGSYKLKDLFIIKGNPQLNKDSFTFSETGEYPYFTRTVLNNGIAGYVDYLDEAHKISGGCLAVGMIGMQFFYMEKDFYAGQFTKRAIPINFKLSKRIAQYFISLLNKYQKNFQSKLVRDFENEFYNTEVFLPVKNNRIDFSFMEKFIAELEAERVAELEAYLEVTGLKDYELTQKEECLLQGDNSPVNWQGFKFREIFNQIKQGRRLKKEDQVKGNIPFVMAGVTNNGVANYISNPVACFPKNSITIDIFGNTFYRNYDFGAGDDTGVYWNTQRNYAMETMLYFATVMRKTVADKFSYGHKLRSSQSLDFIMKLPITRNGKIDYEYMETYISAVQKVIIADVVQYADKKIAAAKQIINSN